METCQKFEDVVNEDTPRIVIEFACMNGAETFRWGMVGDIPNITALGAVAKVQAELYFKAPKQCPAPALVIAYNPASKKVDWFIHPSIPIDLMAGMLEIVKSVILRAGQPKPQGPSILGPDGTPFGGGGRIR